MNRDLHFVAHKLICLCAMKFTESCQPAIVGSQAQAGAEAVLQLARSYFDNGAPWCIAPPVLRSWQCFIAFIVSLCIAFPICLPRLCDCRKVISTTVRMWLDLTWNYRYYSKPWRTVFCTRTSQSSNIIVLNVQRNVRIWYAYFTFETLYVFYTYFITTREDRVVLFSVVSVCVFVCQHDNSWTVK